MTALGSATPTTTSYDDLRELADHMAERWQRFKMFLTHNEREQIMSKTLDELPTKYMDAVEDLSKAREYIAQLERDKQVLMREREELLDFIKGAGRNMAEVVKAHSK